MLINNRKIISRKRQSLQPSFRMTNTKTQAHCCSWNSRSPLYTAWRKKPAKFFPDNFRGKCSRVRKEKFLWLVEFEQLCGKWKHVILRDSKSVGRMCCVQAREIRPCDFIDAMCGHLSKSQCTFPYDLAAPWFDVCHLPVSTRARSSIPVRRSTCDHSRISSFWKGPPDDASSPNLPGDSTTSIIFSCRWAVSYTFWKFSLKNEQEKKIINMKYES